jgi:cytochrome c peroxidase
MIALNTPWDRFQAGATEALSPDARQGAALFASSGCAQCHSGRDLSDGAFHRIIPVDARDPGLMEATGDPADAGRFRTAPLRNVAITGPWLHDGSAKTLGDAITRHPAPPPASTIPSLIAFLEALTDQIFLTDPRFAMPNRACGKRL